MRIAYILTSLGIGGAEKQTIALAELSAARGNAVTIIALKHASEEWPVKLPVLRLNIDRSPAGIWKGLQFARKFLALFRPEIIHSHTYPANLFARVLVAGPGINKVQAILINTIHNVYEGGRLRMLSYRFTSRWVDRVTAVSAAAAERFVESGAVPRRKMFVLTNGIDCEVFAPDRGRRKRMRKLLQAGDCFIWLAVGRLTAAKDYPNLLRAFAEVIRHQPDTRLWIAGEGDCSILDLAIAELGFAETEGGSPVRVLGLRLDIADLLDAADGFVLSSAWEGMPLVVGEAMAMSKTVVATDVGGVRELIGDTGCLVPAKNWRALAEALQTTTLTAEKVRLARGQEARRRIESLFSIRTKAEEWHDLYSKALADDRT